MCNPVWRPPAIATQFSGASIKSRRLRPLPMLRRVTHVIQSCAPAWKGTPHSPVHCNGRLWLGCPVSPPSVGSWPSLLESGRAGSVCSWGCLCHLCVLRAPTIGDAPAGGHRMSTVTTSSCEHAVITRPTGPGATTTSWLASCPSSARLASKPAPRGRSESAPSG